MRGKLTPEIAAKAKVLLGIDITRLELRLMLYVQYVMVNSQRITPRNINEKERKILADWRERGWIEGGASGLAITKEFWDAMCEILWLGYVAHEEGDTPHEVDGNG